MNSSLSEFEALL